MKNLFSILCMFALLTVSFGATANPDVVDTSQKVLCVDDYIPDLEVFVPFEYSPTNQLDVAIELPKAIAKVADLPVPETPNIGFSPTNVDNIYNLSPNVLFNSQLPYSPNIGFLCFDVTNAFTVSSANHNASDAPNPDLTAGFSAECGSNNGTNVPVAKLIKRATYPWAK